MHILKCFWVTLVRAETHLCVQTICNNFNTSISTVAGCRPAIIVVRDSAQTFEKKVYKFAFVSRPVRTKRLKSRRADYRAFQSRPPWLIITTNRTYTHKCITFRGIHTHKITSYILIMRTWIVCHTLLRRRRIIVTGVIYAMECMYSSVRFCFCLRWSNDSLIKQWCMTLVTRGEAAATGTRGRIKINPELDD